VREVEIEVYGGLFARRDRQGPLLAVPAFGPAVPQSFTPAWITRCARSKEYGT